MGRPRHILTASLALATLVVLVVLLRQEGTGFEHLIPAGLIGGMLTGGVTRGRHGLLVGAVIGAVVGAASPFLYAPFWLAFSLPPHVEFDL